MKKHSKRDKQFITMTKEESANGQPEMFIEMGAMSHVIFVGAITISRLRVDSIAMLVNTTNVRTAKIRGNSSKMMRKSKKFVRLTFKKLRKSKISCLA